jgi:hypothetical protein
LQSEAEHSRDAFPKVNRGAGEMRGAAEGLRGWLAAVLAAILFALAT